MELFAVIDGFYAPGVTDEERREMTYGRWLQFRVVPYSPDMPEQGIVVLLPNEHRANWYRDEQNDAHKTYQQAASEAVLVQDACNLGGVSISFRQAVQAVQREARRLGRGTAWIRRHPILVLFIDKMNDLCGRPETSDYSRAWKECEAIARGEETQYEKSEAAA